MRVTEVFSVAVLASVVATLFSTVEGHGMMNYPPVRQISAQYLEDSGVLKNMGGDQIQIAPLEDLSKHKQADYPEAATFDLMNGCRGTVYEEGNNVTTIQPGADFEVKWNIHAPHPGYMTLSIVKPSDGTSGKIEYKNYKTILRVEPFAENGGDGSTTATMPTGVKGCEKAGDCALQFYWYSAIADQTYPTCADIIVPSGGTSTKTTTTAPKATTAAPKTTPTVTKSRSTTVSDASVAGEADSPSKCSRRMRH